MTREELHALVWSEPMRTVAKTMGISDVALAKQCRRANVPVPPRGWWARKAAGKRAEIEPLPPAPFLMANFFPALDQQVKAQSAETTEDAPPVFRDIAEVASEIQGSVRPVKVARTLEKPHPIVARLLKQDEARKFDPHGVGYMARLDAKKFAAPIQQLRLRILSSILFELERLGCKASGSTHAGERFSIKIGGGWTYILFGIEGGAYSSSFHDRGRSSRLKGDHLRFDIVEHDDRTPAKRTWREGDAPLEQQATDIVCGILLQHEEDVRKLTLWWHKHNAEERARKAREAKLAAEKAESDRIAREAASAKARIQSLIDGADAFERAARIRRYVEVVRSNIREHQTSSSEEAFDSWARWALAEADRIDPIVSGEFDASFIEFNGKG